MTTCPYCFGHGLVCAAHPDQPYAHDGCESTGVRCEYARCSFVATEATRHMEAVDTVRASAREEGAGAVAVPVYGITV
jgi:hypothetical protein